MRAGAGVSRVQALSQCLAKAWEGRVVHKVDRLQQRPGGRQLVLKRHDKHLYHLWRTLVQCTA